MTAAKSTKETTVTTDDISQRFPGLAGEFDDAPGLAVQAAAAGDWRAALGQVARIEMAAGQLRQELLREVLATGPAGRK